MSRPRSVSLVYLVVCTERNDLYIVGIERYICVVYVFERQRDFMVQDNVVSLDNRL